MGTVCLKCLNSSCFSSLIKRNKPNQAAVESSSEIIREQPQEIVESQMQNIYQGKREKKIESKLQQKLNAIIHKVQTIKSNEDYYNEHHSSYFLDILQIIHQELQIHEKVYQNVFDTSLAKQLINTTTNSQICKNIAKRILSYILDNMSTCKIKKQVPSQPSFVQDFSKSFSKLKSQIDRFNAGFLKIVSYIDTDPSTRNQEYSHSYLDLNFDLRNEEVLDILKVVNTMLDFQPLSFGFFAHYLYLSCLKLQESRVPMKNISRQIRRCINFLHTQFSYMKISDKEVELNRPPDFRDWPEEAIRYNTIDFAEVSNASIRQAHLQQFFYQRVEEVEQFIPLFTSITQQICRRCKGYGFNCNLRIKDRSQTYVINELKEEVLGYSLISMRPDSLIEGLFQDIITITFQEINEYRNSIKDLIGAIKSTLFIKQGMLLGIALFDKSADVYEASRQIIESVRSQKEVKIVQLQNKLNQKNKGYLTLRLLFKERFITQLRLVRVSLPDYSKKDSLKQIERHNYYYMAQQISRLNYGINCSLYGRTRILSQKYQQFFILVKSYIRNSSQRERNQQSSQRFRNLSQNLLQLFQTCKLCINIYERHYSQTNSLGLLKQFKQLKDIIDQQAQQDASISEK